VRELNTRKATIADLCSNIAQTQIMEINSTDLYSFSDVQKNFETAVKINLEELLICIKKLRDNFGDLTKEVGSVY